MLCVPLLEPAHNLFVHERSKSKEKPNALNILLCFSEGTTNPASY